MSFHIQNFDFVIQLKVLRFKCHFTCRILFSSNYLAISSILLSNTPLFNNTVSVVLLFLFFSLYYFNLTTTTTSLMLWQTTSWENLIQNSAVILYRQRQLFVKFSIATVFDNVNVIMEIRINANKENWKWQAETFILIHNGIQQIRI